MTLQAHIQGRAVAGQGRTAATAGAPGAEKKIAPVQIWAMFGALFTLLSIYVWGRWIFSSPERTPVGSTPLPDWMQLSLDLQLVLGLVALPVFVWFVMIRPWRRDRKMPLDGLLIIAFCQVYWQDTAANMLVPNILINSGFRLQWGSWNNFIPGWTYPHGERVVEPIFWVAPLYVYAMFGVTMLVCWFMRKCKTRWPSLTSAQLIGIAIITSAVADVVTETFWLRSGAYIFNGVFTPKWLTLFDGHYYQFPLSEPVVMAALWTLAASLRYFKDDNGRTVCERGIDSLSLSPRKKTVVRLLALIAAVNGCFMAFDIPIVLLSMHTRAWPKDVSTRTYFTNQLCGPDTDYACPDPAIPLPRSGRASHIAPDGSLVTPAPKH